MKKKRLFLVLFLIFTTFVSVLFLFKGGNGGNSTKDNIKTVSVQTAKLVAQESLVSFESWRSPKLQESYTLYDLNGNPSAYLFNVSDNYGKAGYVTISAQTKIDPVVEISDSTATPIVSALQLVNELTLGTIYEQDDIKSQYLYLGGSNYYVRLQVREGENTQIIYYSIQNGTTKEITQEEIQSKQDLFEDYFEDSAEQKWKPFSS